MTKTLNIPCPKHLRAGATAPLSKTMKERFLFVAGALSPENISWDGERPAREIAKARAKLLAEWRALETEVGRTVTEEEVWS